MANQIKIEGVERTINSLKQKGLKAEKLVKQAIEQATLFIHGEVKESIAGRRNEPTSVDTGRFLNSVQFRIKSPYTGEVSSPVSYAAHLEFGTSRINARKHFRNTVTRNRKKVVSFVKDKLANL